MEIITSHQLSPDPAATQPELPWLHNPITVHSYSSAEDWGGGGGENWHDYMHTTPSNILILFSFFG